MLSPHCQNIATYTRQKKLCIATYVYIVRPLATFAEDQVIPHRQQGLRQPHFGRDRSDRTKS